jgi:hypothetical protein
MSTALVDPHGAPLGQLEVVLDRLMRIGEIVGWRHGSLRERPRKLHGASLTLQIADFEF